MNDTSPEIESRFIEMMMRKSGEERLRMGFEMFNMARTQVIASIRIQKPDADLAEISKELFIRFYGQDFSHDESRKILAHI
ncbi:MAG: hypothetical protein C4581_03625 [Nitrospiraceae bacterium]|nr:MAG: hypothetical protein C4581_03625 [Nitrospiraceae bacterium]